MSIIYKDGAIIAKEIFHKKTCYDVSNNRITVQFDGRGAISRYAVINKYSVFNSYYSLFSINNLPIDWSVNKIVTMVGKKQIIEFSQKNADIVITQFLDNTTNAIFNEISVTAKEDLVFKNVINYGVDYESYLKTFISRFSVRNLGRIVKNLVFPKKRGIEKLENMDYIHNDVTGDYYCDFAISEGATPLETIINHYTQIKYEGKVKAGETKKFRFVLSGGTRADFSFADVKECLADFDNRMLEAEKYIEGIVPKNIEDEFHKAYYTSLLNCSLSNYKELGKFKGFLAGIVYQFPARTYYRDGYWTVLSVLSSRPELVRNEIITLSNGINKKTGKCPSAVKFNFRNYWGDHYDSPSFFVMMLYDYIVHTGDKAILDEKCKCGTILEAAKKVLARLQNNADETGLLVKGGNFNRRDWCDNVFRGGYVTYDEALFARGLFAMSELCKIKEEKTLAKNYYDDFIKVKNAINNLLWDSEKGYYVNYKSGNFVEDNLSIDTVVTVLFGISDEERSLSVLKKMEQLLESKNNTEQIAGDFGTLAVYPFYKDNDAVVQKSSLPYYYHNGGDWPYLSAIYAYAKLMHGMDYEYPLTRWFSYNVEKGNYTPVEFFSPIHPEGSLLQAWSSAGAFVLNYPEGDFFSKTII